MLNAYYVLVILPGKGNIGEQNRIAPFICHETFVNETKRTILKAGKW